MQDLESTRKAFEAYWKSEFIVERADDGRYYDSTVSTGWKHWCRALDYAAEQQAAQCQCDMRTKLVGDGCSVCNPEKAREYMDDETPTPLTRPDRPGWWWVWSEHGTPPRWLPVVVQPGWKCNDGIWVEATPPPDPLTAPTALTDRENAVAGR